MCVNSKKDDVVLTIQAEKSYRCTWVTTIHIMIKHWAMQIEAKWIVTLMMK